MEYFELIFDSIVSAFGLIRWWYIPVAVAAAFIVDTYILPSELTKIIREESRQAEKFREPR